MSNSVDVLVLRGCRAPHTDDYDPRRCALWRVPAIRIGISWRRFLEARLFFFCVPILPVVASWNPDQTASVPHQHPSHDNGRQQAQFCLHGFTSSTVAGTVCNDCGVVVNQIHASVDASYARPPVCKSAPATEPGGGPDGVSATNVATCVQEWKRHTADINNQPNEVMHSAYHTFQLVHQQQGPVSGCKARAVILVSLLYSNRLLYGNNTPNEKYLIQRFNIPTRAMNRAFGSLAAVTLRMTVDVDGQ